MTRTEKKYIVISFLLALFTGVTIYILDNYFQIETEWGVESSPYLSTSKLLHYLSTPLLILSVGLIIKSHIIRKIKNFSNEPKRKTGLIITVGMILLIYTGQSLLFITDQFVMKVMIYSHLIIGVIMGLTLIKHLKK